MKPAQLTLGALAGHCYVSTRRTPGDNSVILLNTLRTMQVSLIAFVLYVFVAATPLAVQVNSATLTLPQRTVQRTPSAQGAVRESPSAVLFRTWIYPLADLGVKVAAGIFVVYYLNRRGSTDKRKDRLIDAYIDFLDESGRMFRIACEQCLRAFWRRFRSDLARAVEDRKLDQTVPDVVDSFVRDRFEKHDTRTQSQQVFGMFKYKFRFLLGKKYYNRFLLPLEPQLVTVLASRQYSEDIAIVAFDDDEVGKQREQAVAMLRLHQSPEHPAVKESLKMLDDAAYFAIGQRLAQEMDRAVNPYSVKAAEGIDAL